MSAPRGSDLREAAAGPLATRLSARYLDEHCVLPLGVDADGALRTAVGGPLDPTVSDELSRIFGRPLRLIEMPAGEIQAAILSVRRDTTGTEPESANGEIRARPEEGGEDLRALANQAPVIKLVNALLLDALRAQASDVHVESTTGGGRVRFRLDGVLHDASTLGAAYRDAVISRIKIMAGLNIAERRLPQDGRARMRLSDRDIDVRVSCLPALHGESLVLRILDHGAVARDLSELGMPPAIERRFDALIRRPSGLLLVTGPTGSGKTTTLYGALARVNRRGAKILTIEDPVEYQIEGVTQIPVNRKAGLSFAGALRSMLRHDPDIIMVGEMRDGETAEIAVQAALTGHLVLSTLHTSDAPGAITRLVQMGIEPYLVAATLRGVLAQRLVRLVCRACGGPLHVEAMMRCDACTRTGFHGRTGIYQLLVMSDALRGLVVERSPLDRLRGRALEEGMIELREDGLGKVEAGLTVRDEVERVTNEGAES